LGRYGFAKSRTRSAWGGEVQNTETKSPVPDEEWQNAARGVAWESRQRCVSHPRVVILCEMCETDNDKGNV